MRVRWPFLVALALAVCALTVRYTVLPGGATARRFPPVQVLTGVTGQGTQIELGVQRGRVRWLRTSLNASCAGGSSWRENWSPAEGAPVHFSMTGRSFVADQLAHPTFPGGVTSAVGFAIRGTLTARSAAQGTIRLVARFYRVSRQWNACDSLDVAWAVGPGARARLRTVTLGRQVNEYYPAVPSLAVDVSPARRRFIARVDRTCVATYGLMERDEAAAAARFRYATDSTLLDSAAYVDLHAWQFAALVKLGEPPEARALYHAWLANFRQRVLVERQAVILYFHHRTAASRRAIASLGPLKSHGNLLGQEFGLVRCTSNGDRTPIPVLSDGQPLPLP